MKPFSFVHVADLHLGYAQYNLDARREDFNRAFTEVVEKALELKPDQSYFQKASTTMRAVTFTSATKSQSRRFFSSTAVVQKP